MKSLFVPTMKSRLLKRPKTAPLIRLSRLKQSSANSARKTNVQKKKRGAIKSLMTQKQKRNARKRLMMKTRISPRSAAAVEAAGADGVKTVKRIQNKQKMQKAKTRVMRRQKALPSLSVAAVKRRQRRLKLIRLRQLYHLNLTMIRTTISLSVREQHVRHLPVKQRLIKMRAKQKANLKSGPGAKRLQRKVLRLQS